MIITAYKYRICIAGAHQGKELDLFHNPNFLQAASVSMHSTDDVNLLHVGIPCDTFSSVLLMMSLYYIYLVILFCLKIFLWIVFFFFVSNMVGDQVYFKCTEDPEDRKSA